jgi:hypothetical protein
MHHAVMAATEHQTERDVLASEVGSHTQHFTSPDPRDQLFGAQYQRSRFEVQWQGASHTHCNDDDADYNKTLRWAIASTLEAHPVATTLLVPDRPTSGFSRLLDHPHVHKLGTVPKQYIRKAKSVDNDKAEPAHPQDDMLLVLMANAEGVRQHARLEAGRVALSQAGGSPTTCAAQAKPVMQVMRGVT